MNRRKLQRIAHIRERLAERHFFLNESLAVLDETLSALDLAERGGAATETISGYSALGLGLGTCRDCAASAAIIARARCALPARWGICPLSPGRIFSPRCSATGSVNGNLRNAVRGTRWGSHVSSGIAPAGTRRLQSWHSLQFYAAICRPPKNCCPIWKR